MRGPESAARYTRAFLWWIAGDTGLSRRGQSAIADEANAVFISAATGWEITTKFRLGKLPGVAGIAGDLAAVLDAQGFSPLAIAFEHGQKAGALPGPLRDPFDRMLVAQAVLEGMTLVSNEVPFDVYPIRRIW